MKEKKLISVRIDADIVAKIDSCAKDWRYWKRSAIINNILRAVIEKTSPNDFDKIARHPSFGKQVQKISVEESNV